MGNVTWCLGIELVPGVLQHCVQYVVPHTSDKGGHDGVGYILVHKDPAGRGECCFLFNNRGMQVLIGTRCV